MGSKHTFHDLFIFIRDLLDDCVIAKGHIYYFNHEQCGAPYHSEDVFLFFFLMAMYDFGWTRVSNQKSQ